MSAFIKDISQLHDYLKGVMERAEHHAPEVSEIVLALAGGVIASLNGGTIQVYTYKGSPANIVWVTVNNKRYCFKYNHEDKEIVVCHNSCKEQPFRTFTNSSPISEVKTFCQRLGDI